MEGDRSIRLHAFGLLIGYGVQFFAGMTLNLFVALPKTHPGVHGKNYVVSSSHGLVWVLSGQGGAALAVHAYLAVGLLLGSLGLFMRSWPQKQRLWQWCGGISAFFTLAAFLNGLSFIDYNHDVSSMIMAACWLLAVGALIYGLVDPSKSLAET